MSRELGLPKMLSRFNPGGPLTLLGFRSRSVIAFLLAATLVVELALIVGMAYDFVAAEVTALDCREQTLSSPCSYLLDDLYRYRFHLLPAIAVVGSFVTVLAAAYVVVVRRASRRYAPASR